MRQATDTNGIWLRFEAAMSSRSVARMLGVIVLVGDVSVAVVGTINHVHIVT